MMSIFRVTLLMLAASLMLQACAIPEVRHGNDAVAAKISAVGQSFPQASDSTNMRPIEFHEGAYLGRKAVPVPRDKLLPPVFARPFDNPATLLSSEGRVSLGTVAEHITQYTGIPVEIDPNVSIRSNQERAAAGNVGGAPATAQARPGGSSLSYDDERNLVLNYYKGPLSKFLDMVVARLGISWEYDAGKIRFFRYKSQTFEVKAVGGTKKLSTRLSSSGETTGTASAGAQTTIGTSQVQERTINAWEAIGSSVNAMLSPGGKLVPNESGGTLTVVDTPAVLRRVGEYLAGENRRAVRSVYLRVEMITLKSNRDGQIGVDLALSLAKGNFRSVSAPITSVVSSIGSGGLNTTMVDGSAANSELFLRALAANAVITGQVAVNAYTVNNHPVPFTLGATQSYIDSVGTSQAQTSTSVTVTQKQLTTGVFIELLPHLLDDNRMLLQYVIDLSSDPDFTVIDTGGPASLPKIQSPRVARKATAQTVNIAAGQTLVLTQMGREDSREKQSAGLTGASAASSHEKETTVILITPVLIDNDV